MYFPTLSEAVKGVEEKLNGLAQQVRRVAAQQLGLALSDQHAEDIACWLCWRSRGAFGHWLGYRGQLPTDCELGAALMKLRSETPAIFDAPSRDKFTAALKSRGIPNAENIAANLSEAERRREWLGLTV